MKRFPVVVIRVSYLTGQLSMLAAKQGAIGFDRYCYFNSYCYLSSEGQNYFVNANVRCLVILIQFPSRTDLMRQPAIGQNV